MTLSSEIQRTALAPVVAYFDRKRCQREERDVGNKRFVASVRELIRAEGRDQVEWNARRRRRVQGDNKQASPRCRADVRTPRSGAGVTQAAARSSARCTRPARKALPSKKKTESCLDAEKARGANKSTSASQSPLNVPGGHQQQARLPDDRRPPGASRRTQTNKTNGCRSRQPRSAPAVDKKEDIDITQAMKRLSQLKSLLTKASDPPQIAAEMATLHLVLSDHRGALKSFRLAVEPSPEPVLTRQELDQKEMQERKLLLLAKERQAAARAELEAQEAEKQHKRETTELERRRQAATGMYQCLLELKQPIAAAEAAKMRLGMCKTDEERRQVEVEIHEALLRHDGLVELEATNQGAWLTESAGALSDLHASVLESLTGFVYEVSKPPCFTGAQSPRRTTNGQCVTRGNANSLVACGSSREGGNSGAKGDRSDVAPMGCHIAMTAIGEGRGGGGRNHTRVEAMVGRGAETKPQRERSRLLCYLGRALARKRQFAASRQAFEQAIRGDPDEVSLRERNKGYTRNFFLDMALDEATPTLRIDLESRWQGGVEADETRRTALVDFAGFTGVHHGAETLVAAVPGGGWADGVSDVAYAERFSKERAAAGPLLQMADTRDGVEVAAAIDAKHMTSGLMLGHKVSPKDVIQA